MKKYVPINDPPPQSIQVGGARGGGPASPPPRPDPPQGGGINAGKRNVTLKTALQLVVALLIQNIRLIYIFDTEKGFPERASLGQVQANRGFRFFGIASPARINYVWLQNPIKSFTLSIKAKPLIDAHFPIRGRQSSNQKITNFK